MRVGHLPSIVVSHPISSGTPRAGRCTSYGMKKPKTDYLRSIAPHIFLHITTFS